MAQTFSHMHSITCMNMLTWIQYIYTGKGSFSMSTSKVIQTRTYRYPLICKHTTCISVSVFNQILNLRSDGTTLVGVFVEMICLIMIDQSVDKNVLILYLFSSRKGQTFNDLIFSFSDIRTFELSVQKHHFFDVHLYSFLTFVMIIIILFFSSAFLDTQTLYKKQNKNRSSKRNIKQSNSKTKNTSDQFVDQMHVCYVHYMCEDK